MYEKLTDFLFKNVSMNRFDHSVSVGLTCMELLERFGAGAEITEADGMNAGYFLGLAHDLAREFSDAEILAYAAARELPMPEEFIKTPVLAHGLIATRIVKENFPEWNIPESWNTAMVWHTTGNVKMGRLGLALFIADFVEPKRSFLSEEKRQEYYAAGELNKMGMMILNDMIAHWKSKGIVPSQSSLNLQIFFEEGNLIY